MPAARNLIRALRVKTKRGRLRWEPAGFGPLYVRRRGVSGSSGPRVPSKRLARCRKSCGRVAAGTVRLRGTGFFRVDATTETPRGDLGPRVYWSNFRQHRGTGLGPLYERFEAIRNPQPELFDAHYRRLIQWHTLYKR